MTTHQKLSSSVVRAVSGIRAALLLADAGYGGESVALLRAEKRFAEGTRVDADRMGLLHAFLNHNFDAYVHGAYETSTELYNPSTGLFMMRGHESPGICKDHIEAVAGKLHEVVVAVEFTARLLGNSHVQTKAGAARSALDAAASSANVAAEAP